MNINCMHAGKTLWCMAKVINNLKWHVHQSNRNYRIVPGFFLLRSYLATKTCNNKSTMLYIEWKLLVTLKLYTTYMGENTDLFRFSAYQVNKNHFEYNYVPLACRSLWIPQALVYSVTIKVCHVHLAADSLYMWDLIGM